MKIALFGGAFDPPHLGHKVVADSIIKNKIVDEVWFIPVFKHPWADRYVKHQFAPYDKRVKMLEMSIVAKNPKIPNISSKKQQEISANQKVEHYKDVSFTFDTLEYFSKKFPQHKFSWVMGSEYLSRFDDFLKVHPGLLDYQFYIYPRAGYPFMENLKKNNMIFLYDMPEVTASSTQIKELFKHNQNPNDLMLSAVLQFAENNKLY